MNAYTNTSFLVLYLITSLITIANAKTLIVTKNIREFQNTYYHSVFHTLDKAIQTLMPGDTLLIDDGVYREPIILPIRDWSIIQPTMIKAINPGRVTLKGSKVVTNWKKYLPRKNIYYVDQWRINTQQVFIDGVPLKQIGGIIFNGFPVDKHHQFHSYFKNSSIWPDRIPPPSDIESIPLMSFYYDEISERLFIRLKKQFVPIKNHTIEVSIKPHLIYGSDANGLYIKGINIQHSNTSSVSRAGAVTLRGNNITLENINVSYVDSVGINISGNNNKIINSTMNHCGQLGLKARGKNVLISGNTTNWNNTRGFNKWWEAGGAKFVGEYGLRYSRITNHIATHNNGDGLWFDWGNHHIEIDHSISAYNNGFGIHYEASSHANIHHNFVIKNNQRGVYLPHSSYSHISYNLIAFNGLSGVVVIDEGRIDPKGTLKLRPSGNSVSWNIIAWNNPDRPLIILPVNHSGMNSDNNLFILRTDIPPKFSAGWSLLRPFMRSIKLNTWQNVFNFDQNSYFIVAQPDKDITKCLNSYCTDFDWSQLKSFSLEFAQRYKSLTSLDNLSNKTDNNHICPGPYSFNR